MSVIFCDWWQPLMPSLEMLAGDDHSHSCEMPFTKKGLLGQTLLFPSLLALKVQRRVKSGSWIAWSHEQKGSDTSNNQTRSARATKVFPLCNRFLVVVCLQSLQLHKTKEKTSTKHHVSLWHVHHMSHTLLKFRCWFKMINEIIVSCSYQIKFWQHV